MDPVLREDIQRFCDSMDDGTFVSAADILHRQSYWDRWKFLRSYVVDIQSTIERCEEMEKLYERCERTTQTA